MGSGNGLGACYDCIKYLMFAFNFIFWLIGCALVGLGIWMLVDDTLKDLAKDQAFSTLMYASIAVICVGGVVMVIGFFGCCGAIRESKCLLVTFFVWVFLLFAVLVAGGVYVLINTDKLVMRANEEFEKQMKPYEEKESRFVDLIQKLFSCCGYTNAENDFSAFRIVKKRFPLSCPTKKPNELKAGTPSCKPQVEKFIRENGVLLGGVTIGVGVVMLIGMIFSMLLVCAIRQSYD